MSDSSIPPRPPHTLYVKGLLCPLVARSFVGCWKHTGAWWRWQTQPLIDITNNRSGQREQQHSVDINPKKYNTDTDWFTIFGLVYKCVCLRVKTNARQVFCIEDALSLLPRSRQLETFKPQISQSVSQLKKKQNKNKTTTSANRRRGGVQQPAYEVPSVLTLLVRALIFLMWRIWRVS